MSPLQQLLHTYRTAALTEREKGTYFEELTLAYFRHEATYADLYEQLWTYADWARANGLPAKDNGIDLVARTRGTHEIHAIQCKFYAEDHVVRKSDIDSFFTASGQKPFTHRLIVTTAAAWTDNAEAALAGQQPPVTKLDLHDLENSRIDWSRFQPGQPPPLKPRKTLRPHQTSAKNAVLRGLKDADRGKLIMACGTGKPFTSLKIAEELTGKGGRVLFLVPSLALLSQSLTEWTRESDIPLHSFAVCSDDEVGKKRKTGNDDAVQTLVHELRYPATTDGKRLAHEMQKRHDAHHLSVVFSTYHSIQVLSEAQHLHGLPPFDLVICDEAHRTTGATFDTADESNFVRVHDPDFLRARKRLYMTATPRIYNPLAQATAERDNITLCSMDNPALYGEQLHVITFSEAVHLGLLTDYKVIVLTIDSEHVSDRLQDLLKDDDNQLKVDDAARIVGCWKALGKHGIRGEIEDMDNPMRRAVAFCQVIEPRTGASTHRVSSKQIAAMFQQVVDAYNANETERQRPLACEAEHVDGSMNATEKDAKLTWLKAELPPNTCRILSNVRCLSEGVDVPALDAVLFLSPRNSQVDVVQSVGRVMRNAPGKKRGYVILPVVIPSGMDPAEALADNKVYKVVWEVLQALRSHDDQFDAMINKLELIGSDPRKMEVVAISDKVPAKPKDSIALTAKQKKEAKTKTDEFTLGSSGEAAPRPKQAELQFNVGELERALYARIVKKCGNRNYWDEWAKDIAQIANTHIARIHGILKKPENKREIAAFQSFVTELRDDLNEFISDDEVVEMLAQHLITKPVFDALFKDYSFASHNPVSLGMQQILDILQEHRLDKEADTLEKFYASVEMRAAGIDNAAGKQKIVVELYDKFFRNAFPKMTERLGIVYTPVEVVDFIIHSVNDLLQQEFGQTLGSEGVHIIDPFTGTGTFITRLLQSGLIDPKQLPHKYKHEIHANEIVLLAYYIAAINIESVYHDLAKGDYIPFTGICLTDTFQPGERDDLVSSLMGRNSKRRNRQNKLDIRVILGNPPYSAGQESANDNNQNIAYPVLDERIRETYAAHSSATNKNALYDSYIRAIRWASDRIGDAGIIGFVTNAGFLEANTADGLRKCLAEEFSNIYVFHLRGNQRTSGELSRKEGGKIFGSGSRAPIAITLLVKNPESKTQGNIHWHDIGDYLTQQQKLEIVASFRSLNGITQAKAWTPITPDAHHDWINQRDDSFDEFIKIGDKKDPTETTIFDSYSNGIKTNRDAWCYNFSKSDLTSNMQRMIGFYHSEIQRYAKEATKPKVDSFIDTNPTKISWNRGLKNDFAKRKHLPFKPGKIFTSLYRPFSKNWAYFDKDYNDMVYQMPKFFPEPDTENKVICVTGLGETKGFTSLISDVLPNLHFVAGGQCFPLYLYEKAEEGTPEDDLFAGDKKTKSKDGYIRRDGISDAGLAYFQKAYPGETITKEDLFYYIYGLLHSPDYRSRYADNLSKELPRIPAVKGIQTFRAFSQAGRRLADLHLHYESADKYPVTLDTGKLPPEKLTPDHYRVTKMRFGKTSDPATGKTLADKTVIHYNPHITLRNIPLEAYHYIVNGKPAIEWVMERQSVTTDKASQITNDANLYAHETKQNPRYPLDLLQQIITVSLETMKVVDGLPELEK